MCAKNQPQVIVRQTLEPAFPEDNNRPPEATQQAGVSAITISIRFDLGFPKLHIRGR
jgi:hypothetical protein